MTQIVNGLPATPARRALAAAIAAGKGRIYYEPAAKAAFDRTTGLRITERLRDLVRHDWAHPAVEGDVRPGESKLLVHYRLTDYGRAALKGEGR